MLGSREIELIHREIDGENTPQDSVAFQALVARNPEAHALAAELRELAALLGKVEQRAAPPGIRPAVLEALREHSCPSPETASAGNAVHSPVQSFVFQLRSATIRMEKVMMTKRKLVLGTTMAAAVAVIAALLSGYPPTGLEVGTMGGRDDSAGEAIAGVQQASRFRNKAVTERDVTLGNPEVQLLFQNHEILNLVKSDEFRRAMRDDAFRNLQSDEAFARLQHDEAFARLQSNEVFRGLLRSDEYRSLNAREAYARMLKSEAFRNLQSNEAYRAVLSSDVFRQSMENDVFRTVMANEVFARVMAKDAYRQLNSSDVFRTASRSQAASELFLNEAMRAQQ
jgi:hypothetical protein